MAPLVNKIPEIAQIKIEVLEASGPFDAQGIGEITTFPVAPTIANAITYAVGVRLIRIPMTPKRIWKALQNSD